jgi:hypothetical protein
MNKRNQNKGAHVWVKKSGAQCSASSAHCKRVAPFKLSHPGSKVASSDFSTNEPGCDLQGEKKMAQNYERLLKFLDGQDAVLEGLIEICKAEHGLGREKAIEFLAQKVK